MKMFYSHTIKGCVFVMLYAGLKRGKVHYNIINEDGVEVASCVPQNRVLERCRGNCRFKKLQGKRNESNAERLDDFLDYTTTQIGRRHSNNFMSYEE